MGLNELAKEVYKNAKSKGFYDNTVEIGTRLMLIVSEVSEALEADRIDHYANLEGYFESINSDHGYDELYAFKKYFNHFIKDTFEDELADIVIRVMDLSAFRGVDLQEHITLKMKFNSFRENKHGKKY